MKIVSVVGTRPNVMKVAAVHRALQRHAPAVELCLVHTGQHYDELMSNQLFRDLQLPPPNVQLGIGPGAPAGQVAKMIGAFERALETQQPDMVLVVGDVNSTLACAVVAAQRRIPLGHVEAGLRSFDRTMPEELNRIVTDTLATYLFTPTREAGDNLRREGVADERIFFVGNVMIDVLHQHREAARDLPLLQQWGLAARPYGVVTLHRPSNVDDPAVLGRLVEAIKEVQRRLPLVWPLHPRTRQRLAAAGLLGRCERMPAVRCLEPLGYLAMLHVLDKAAVVLTDSGGIQEETTVLGVPCLTLRKTTERPVTLQVGTNRLVGPRPAEIVRAVEEALTCDRMGDVNVPEGWDGRAAERIADILLAETASCASA